MIIRQARQDDYSRILELNKDLVHFLSPMDRVRLESLADQSEYFLVVEIEEEVQAFLIALREGKVYDSLNYLWFSKNYKEFLYIDRIVVAKEAMHQGLGHKLYSYIFDREKNVDYIAAEIDILPVNQVSLDFHERFGFKEVGTQVLGDKEKEVSLQISSLKDRQVK